MPASHGLSVGAEVGHLAGEARPLDHLAEQLDFEMMDSMGFIRGDELTTVDQARPPRLSMLQISAMGAAVAVASTSLLIILHVAWM